MAEMAPSPVREPSFRERLPDRLTVFGIGGALAVLAGLVAGSLLDMALGRAVGFAMMLAGAVCLLGGGLTGGRYEVYGIGYGVGRNHSMRGDGSRVATESLRAGYDRPKANPAAFWQTIGGFLYLGIGLLLIVLIG